MNHHLARQPSENGIVPVHDQGSILRKGKFSPQEASELSPVMESGIACEMLDRTALEPTQLRTRRVFKNLTGEQIVGAFATREHLVFRWVKAACTCRIPHSLNERSSRGTIRNQRDLLTSEILHNI